MDRAAVARRLRERSPQIVLEATRRIATEIPSYAAASDDLIADVSEHIGKHHVVLVDLMEAGRRAVHNDMTFTRTHTAARVGRIPIADYLHAFRTYLDVIWLELLEQAHDAASAETVLMLVGLVLDYVNEATTYAAELYIEIEQLELAGGERVRRDLLEDLVGGRPVLPGPRQDIARDAGLGPTTSCLVVVAVPRGGAADEQSLRTAASALARACRTPLRPLTVLRRDEIVVVAPTRDGQTDEVIRTLTQTQQKLNQQRLPLAVGVSTVHPAITSLPSAYQEARGAAESVGTEGGIIALPALSALDYLTSFRDPTAQRLVPPNIWRFVSADLEHGGVLTSTLLAYVECDLNVKAMSKRMFIHSNTAHHRLHRIAEQTGLDLRRLGDVLSIVVAIRLARPLGDRPPGAWG
ncbi:MAG TPA: helix-turn-helix domain-containing protein [Candidatus Dormibacteraeota bacterium]